jgi:hypothetical protein
MASHSRDRGWIDLITQIYPPMNAVAKISALAVMKAVMTGTSCLYVLLRGWIVRRLHE